MAMRREAKWSRWPVALVVLAVVCVVSILPAGHVAAGAGLSATPSFPSAVSVGQLGIAASITITNNNTPPDVATNAVPPRRLSLWIVVRVLRRRRNCADTVLRSAVALIRDLHRTGCRPRRVSDQSDGDGVRKLCRCHLYNGSAQRCVRPLPVRSASRRPCRPAYGRIGVHDQLHARRAQDADPRPPGRRGGCSDGADRECNCAIRRRDSRRRSGFNYAGHSQPGHAESSRLWPRRAWSLGSGNCPTRRPSVGWSIRLVRRW